MWIKCGVLCIKFDVGTNACLKVVYGVSIWMQVAMFTKKLLVILNKGSPTYFLSLHMSIGKMKYNDICEPPYTLLKTWVWAWDREASNKGSRGPVAVATTPGTAALLQTYQVPNFIHQSVRGDFRA